MDIQTFDLFMKLATHLTTIDDLEQLKVIQQALGKLSDSVEFKIIDLEPEPEE